PQNVTWTSVAPTIQVTGNSLQKVSGTSSWYDAGAVSSQTIQSGDGYVEFTPGNTATWRMIGLGNGNTSYHYADIEFAFYVAGGGGLHIYEGGVYRGQFGTYTSSDLLRVAVEAGVVKYRKNGALVYTSTVTPTYPLLVDTSLNTVNSQLVNVVISGGGGSGSDNIKWLVADHLGTPRMVFDKTGSLAGTKRHDYLAFGEEWFAGMGGRTTNEGYVADGVRQKFTLKERDNETNLDYFGARYYASTMGRFISPDDFLNDTFVADPSSWNLYAYVRNKPLILIDPNGQEVFSSNLTDQQKKKITDDLKKKTGYKSISFNANNKLVVDTSAGYKKGSATARTELLAATTSTSKVFNLVAVDNTALSHTVAFAENVGTQTIVNAATGARTDVYDTRIDFGDFRQLKGEKKAFSLGINLIHEFEHGLHDGQPTGSDRPNGPTDPGPLERTYINPIRRELGLPERVRYSGVLQSTGKHQGYVQLPFRNARGKEKMLRWRDSVVGGRRTP
ncbi:MAG TPA: RHS repeat-associated core domain-containing protein, partial [Pyrinomonadaceae bacterium]|nr:RHS repeat-associated core domain-containing protein [Pyrinomonadaceae bacterium]